MNNNSVKAQSDDPPYEKNGSGIPITGTSPMTMPTFTARWKKRIHVTQYP
jgi:hypothetical protein